MTIEELKVKKRDLECAICEMLHNFEVETKTRITGTEYTSKVNNTFAAFDFKIKIEV